MGFALVKASFDLVDEKQQLKILNIVRKKFEEGEPLNNPTTWIQKACERSAERHQEIVRERKQARLAEAQEWAAESEEPVAPPKKKQKLAPTEAVATAAAPEEEAAADDEWPEEDEFPEEGALEGEA